MKRAFHIRPVTRRRLAWLVALLLLCQQVAVAAYACQLPSPTVAMAAAVMSATAPAMVDDNCAGMPDVSPSPLCKYHCAPEHATQVTAQATSVPLNTLTAVPPVLLSVAIVALQSERIRTRREYWRTPPPVPRLLFCSLLI